MRVALRLEGEFSQSCLTFPRAAIGSSSSDTCSPRSYTQIRHGIEPNDVIRSLRDVYKYLQYVCMNGGGNDENVFYLSILN